MAERKRILVTGMSGLIGGVSGHRLAQKHEVRALNRRAVEGVETFQADIRDLDAIRPAFEGVDTVVHMAAYRGGSNSTQQISVNVWGTYNVFEAAREAGARRVVFASSGATVHGYESEEPFRAMVEARYADIPEPRPLITHLSPVRPTNLYGCAKVWGEALARSYSEAHGVSALCIRLGRVTAEDRPVDTRHAAVYLSLRDAAQMVERCVEAPEELRFDIYFAVSDNRARFRDIAHPREVIGYVPQDGVQDWPEAPAQGTGS
jgi:nucleoside-diphosphate-sugar epimerase